MNRFLPFRQLVSVACFLLMPAAALAAYPDKPIKLIVTFAPGGASDIVARTIHPTFCTNDIEVEARAVLGGHAVGQLVGVTAAPLALPIMSWLNS